VSYRDWAQKQYKTKRWQKIRAQQLARQPYCQCPHHVGKKIQADTVDHIDPHKGDSRKFWNTANLQSLTRRCHDKYKSSQERGGPGFLMGCDADGIPLSRDHFWHE